MLSRELRAGAVSKDFSQTVVWLFQYQYPVGLVSPPALHLHGHPDLLVQIDRANGPGIGMERILTAGKQNVMLRCLHNSLLTKDVLK